VAIDANVRWVKDLQFVGRAGNGPAVVIDSTKGGSGASPMELLLLGVAGCTAIDVVLIMEKKRARLTNFEVNITGHKAETEPQRYTDIEIEYVLTGKSIKPKGVEQAIALSEEKYCSALASLNARVTHSYRIEPPAVG
jgi:putative redox protein